MGQRKVRVITMTQTLSLFFWFVVFVLISAGVPSRAEDLPRPPNDDSDQSTIRITTAWETHSFDVKSCVQHAATSLSAGRYFVDTRDLVVFGLRNSMTALIRCDYPGVAFFVVAYRHRPGSEAEARIMDDIKSRFFGGP
jgi:hypothetical protein